MSLISQTITNLFGGVSQSPSAQRDASQFSELTNALATWGRRLGRRPSKGHLTKLALGAVDLSDAFVYPVTISTGAKVNLIVTNGQVLAYDAVNGAQYAVSSLGITPTLDVGGDFRAASQGNSTVILNRNVTVQKAADVSPTQPYEALLSIRQGDYETTYTVTLDGRTVSHTTPIATAAGAKAGIATTAIATLLQGAILADTVLNASFEVGLYGSSIYLKRLDGADFALVTSDGLSDKGMVPIKGEVQQFADLPTKARPGMVVKVAGNAETTIDDYYVQFNDALSVGGRGVWKEVVKPSTLLKLDPGSMPVCVTWEGNWMEEQQQRGGTIGVSRASYTPQSYFWHVELPGDAIFPPSTTVTVTIQGVPFNYVTSATSTLTVDQVFSALTTIILASPTYDASWSTSIYAGRKRLTVYRTDTAVMAAGAVTIAASYNPATMFWPEQDGIIFTSLVGLTLRNLTDGSSGTVTASTDYMVTVDALSGGVLNKFSAGDKVIVEGPAGSFLVAPCPWKTRRAGDDTSVPFPSFVGEKLNDVAFHDGRLAFSHGRSISMSRSGDPHDFFRESATAVLASDPIDVEQAGGGAAPFHAILNWNDALYLWSAADQSVLTSGNNALSADTVAIRTVSHYPNDPTCRPVAVGQRIFFASKQYGFTHLHDFHLSRFGNTHEAVNVTLQAPAYVAGTPRRIAADESLGLVLVQTDDATLFVYSFKDLDGDRVQSAWSKWTFASGKIVGLSFVDGVVTLVTRYADGSMLEALKLTEEMLTVAVTEGYDIFDGQNIFDGSEQYDGAGGITTYTTRHSRVYLDRRISSLHPEVTANYVGGYTTWTLPYELEYGGADGQLVVVHERTGELLPAFRRGSKLQVSTPQDYSLEVVQIGVLYQTRIELSQLYFRRSEGEADERGRLQLRFLKAHYAESTELTVTVQLVGRDPKSYVMQREDLDSGTFTVPIQGRNTDCTILLSIDGPGSLFLTSYEWEGTYSTRERRL